MPYDKQHFLKWRAAQQNKEEKNMKYTSIDISLLPDLDAMTGPLINGNTEDILVIVATYFWENGAINSMMF